jgi:hypothetical protein
MEKIAALVLSAVLLTQSFSVAAFETDQYNLPEKPLADVGDEVNAYVRENITEAIGKINSRIAARLTCLKTRSGENGCDSPEKETARLAELRLPPSRQLGQDDREDFLRLLGFGRLLECRSGGEFRRNDVLPESDARGRARRADPRADPGSERRLLDV